MGVDEQDGFRAGSSRLTLIRVAIANVPHGTLPLSVIAGFSVETDCSLQLGYR